MLHQCLVTASLPWTNVKDEAIDAHAARPDPPEERTCLFQLEIGLAVQVHGLDVADALRVAAAEQHQVRRKHVAVLYLGGDPSLCINEDASLFWRGPFTLAFASRFGLPPQSGGTGRVPGLRADFGAQYEARGGVRMAAQAFTWLRRHEAASRAP